MNHRPPRAARCATCGCRSPTAATCAANTACRRTTTSGCRARTCCTSRRSARSSTSSCRSASTRSGSPAASRCCAATCRRSCACLPAKPGLDDLALTTNGVLLAEQVDALKPPASDGSRSASTRSAPIASLELTRFDELDAVHDGIAAAHRVVRPPQDRHRRHPRRQRRRAGGSDRVRQVGRTPRCGSSSTWTSAAPRAGRPTRVVSRREMLERLARHYGAIEPIVEPARPRRPIDSRCRTARSSASSRRRPIPSAAPATAAG